MHSYPRLLKCDPPPHRTAPSAMKPTRIPHLLLPKPDSIFLPLNSHNLWFTPCRCFWTRELKHTAQGTGDRRFHLRCGNDFCNSHTLIVYRTWVSKKSILILSSEVCESKQFPLVLINDWIILFISVTKYTVLSSWNQNTQSKFLLVASESWNQNWQAQKNHQVLLIIYLKCCHWIFQTQEGKILVPGLRALTISTFCGAFSSLYPFPFCLSFLLLFSLNMSCSERSLVIHIKYTPVTFLFFKRSMIIANCNKRSWK